MLDAPTPLPTPDNEPILSYRPGSPERAELESRLNSMRSEAPDLPHVVGGKERGEGEAFDVRSPHDHARVIGRAHDGASPVAKAAIDAALAAQRAWAETPFDERARVFMRAADLLAGPWRPILNAATMLGQSKTVVQAEIDAACELIDFLRFNVAYASRLAEQPQSAPGIQNEVEWRPLEGFVLAITPFNFTAIAGNLPTAPAMLGNVVVWKPSESQALAAHYTMKLFEAAGLPPGVINLVHGSGASVAEACLASPHLAGVHFTGSTDVFRSIWKRVGERIETYRTYPRLVGETGGKDFVFAHPSAELEPLAVALVRGAYEFQGQKCSAASRAYIPKSLWKSLEPRLVDEIKSLTIGDVSDFSNFMGAVIHERSWTKLSGWRDRLRSDAGCRVIADDGWSRETGWFAGPTLVEVSDPKHDVMQTELFGPILSVYVYDDAKVDETLALLDETSPYGLTGAVFARDRKAIAHAAKRLRHAAGNFYVNDKPTGAVVGQQPFGGGRASGTNDKAGSALNLIRWTSPRTLKETFVPPTAVTYPAHAKK